MESDRVPVSSRPGSSSTPISGEVSTVPAEAERAVDTDVDADPVVGGERGSVPGREGWRRLSAGDGTFDQPPIFDIALAVLLGSGLLTEVLIASARGTSAALVPLGVGLVLVVVIAAPLAWRRVVPLITMACSGVATGVFTLSGHSLGLAGLTLMVALYSVAAYGTRFDAWVSAAITAGFVVVGHLAVWLRTGDAELGPMAGTALVLAGVWVLGDRTRARRQVVAQLEVRARELERHQELTAQLAAADERRRIARELHDVVAHAVSVVVVQASAGRRVAERDPAAAIGVLQDIESSGREALAELRRLVAVLRDDGPAGENGGQPQPTLADVPGLVARLQEAGVPVRLERTGTAGSIPPGVAVSAYRIVQESLTNVLKHAGVVSEVVVALDQRPDLLSIEVRDDGRGARPPAAPDIEEPPTDGTGLTGMRERAAILGGQLAAGPRVEGGFRVSAQLPLPAERRGQRPTGQERR